MADQLITVSLYTSVLANPVNRNTKLLLKGNQTFSLHDSRACSDNCLLISIDHGTKQENFLQMWRRSPRRFFVSVLYFVFVDRCAVFENGIDKQENRDKRTTNFESGSPCRDRIIADNRPQKWNGNTRKWVGHFDFEMYYTSGFRIIMILLTGWCNNNNNNNLLVFPYIDGIT